MSENENQIADEKTAIDLTKNSIPVPAIDPIGDLRKLCLMKSFDPKKMFFTRGVGVHRNELTSFEWALRNAGIAGLNIVNVSSICPPHCKVIPKKEGLSQIKDGRITFAVVARINSDEPFRYMAASIGLALPKDHAVRGYISEFHGHGYTHQQAGDRAEDMAAEMLGSTLGIDLDPNTAWKEKEEVYKASGKIIRTTNFTQFARGHKDRLWTTAISVAVFLE